MGKRAVSDIDLMLTLVLLEHDEMLYDTLLHEMAHAAAWLVDGCADHGIVWTRWAARAGARYAACVTGPRLAPSDAATLAGTVPVFKREHTASATAPGANPD